MHYESIAYIYEKTAGDMAKGSWQDWHETHIARFCVIRGALLSEVLQGKQCRLTQPLRKSAKAWPLFASIPTRQH